MWAISATTGDTRANVGSVNLTVRGQFHNGRPPIITLDRPTPYIRSTIGSGPLGRHSRPDIIGSGLSAKFIYTSATVVFVLCRYADWH